MTEGLERSQAAFGELRNLLRLRQDELRDRVPPEPLTAPAGAALLESVAEQVGRQLRRRVQAQRRPGNLRKR